MTGSWDDVATVALLGTARRRVDEHVLPEPLRQSLDLVSAPMSDQASDQASDPAVRLLDVAALGAVFLRAGLRARPAPPLPVPALEDPRPPVGASARARLAGLLAADDRELLRIWLATAADRRLRLPSAALPRLLDLAGRDRTLAPLVIEAGGPRAAWLAARRRHWSGLLAEATLSAPATADRSVWELGTPGERRAWLAALRAEDRGAARGLLDRSWASQAPAERAGLLAVLRDGLGADDETLLERCLDDRRAEVRSLAARMLSGLPGSAFAVRAAGRARAVVRVEPWPLPGRVVVTPPAGPDEAGSPDLVRELARDQISVPAGTGPGARGRLVRQLVAAAPLSTWTPAPGGEPAAIAGLAVADDWAAPLWLGWAAATVRERDAAWTTALLDHVPWTTGAHPSGSAAELSAAIIDLIAVLPAADGARRVAALLTVHGAGSTRPPAVPGTTPTHLPANVPVPLLLRQVPGPWSRPLTGAVLGWLRRRSRLDDAEGRAVLDLAARRLPVELAGAMRELADRWPPSSPGRRTAAAAADLLVVRHDMLEELQ